MNSTTTTLLTLAQQHAVQQITHREDIIMAMIGGFSLGLALILGVILSSLRRP